jgi:hypothetical protein
VPGKVAQFDRFLLSQGTGMASLVMTALQWTEKWGRKALGLSLSGGVLTNEPEAWRMVLWVGIDFSPFVSTDVHSFAKILILR